MTRFVPCLHCQSLKSHYVHLCGFKTVQNWQMGAKKCAHLTGLHLSGFDCISFTCRSHINVAKRVTEAHEEAKSKNFLTYFWLETITLFLVLASRDFHIIPMFSSPSSPSRLADSRSDLGSNRCILRLHPRIARSGTRERAELRADRRVLTYTTIVSPTTIAVLSS